jgi:hypothetical protein
LQSHFTWVWLRQSFMGILLRPSGPSSGGSFFYAPETAEPSEYSPAKLVVYDHELGLNLISHTALAAVLGGGTGANVYVYPQDFISDFAAS